MNKYLYIKTPPTEKHDHATIENFGRLIDTLRKVLDGGEKVSFELFGYKGIVYFFVCIDEKLLTKFNVLVYSIFPSCEILESNVDPLNIKKDVEVTVYTMKMRKSFVVPIKTFNTLRMDSVPDKVKETSAAIEFYKDSLSPIASFLAELRGEQKGWMQLVLTSQKEHFFYLIMKKIAKYLHGLHKKIRFRDKRKEGLFEKEKELMEHKDKTDHIRVRTSIGVASSDRNSGDLCEMFFRSVQAYYSDDSTNKFLVEKKLKGEAAILEARKRKRGPYSLFNVDELITLLHLPNPKDIPHFSAVISKKAEPPADLPPTDAEGNCMFGMTNYHGSHRNFGILRKDRIRHSYILGKSGSGKSKLFELLIKNDLETGQGIGIIDPHGDLIDNIMTYIPENRIKDVVLVNPLDTERPVPFNPLEKVEPKLKMQVTNGFVNIFKKAFGSNWNARLEHVLRYSVLALLDAGNATVFSIKQMISEREFRQKVIRKIKDESVANFWTNEFPAWTEKYSSEAINPLLNKLGQLAGNTMIKNVISVEKNTFNIREMMDNQKILLVKLPKGILGEENIQLLGAMFITKIYQAAMSRQDIPEEQRKDFYLYVDEFQNFTTDSFGEILSEARKYRLVLNMAHQFLGQLSEQMKKTVFGNVGSLVTFRMGGEDAQHFVKEYTPVFIERDLINLGVREFYCKVTINGEIHKAFSGKTMFLEKSEKNFSDQIVENSRQVFGVNLEEEARKLAKQQIIDSGGVIEDDIQIDKKLLEMPFPEPFEIY